MLKNMKLKCDSSNEKKNMSSLVGIEASFFILMSLHPNPHPHPLLPESPASMESPQRK